MLYFIRGGVRLKEELRMSKERELTYREALKEIKSVSSKTDKKEERLKMINKISITALEIFEEQA